MKKPVEIISHEDGTYSALCWSRVEVYRGELGECTAAVTNDGAWRALMEADEKAESIRVILEYAQSLVLLADPEAYTLIGEMVKTMDAFSKQMALFCPEK